MSEALVIPTTAAELTIGAPAQGGYFAGIINVNGTLYGVTVSPKAIGDLPAAPWGSAGIELDATSCCDGLANTQAMAAAGSESARAILALNIDGFNDWYLPARDELELAYRNLKPRRADNWASFRDGDNPSSVPGGYPYTEQLPHQTGVPVFQEGGPEAFDSVAYWTSTQYSAYNAWGQAFGYGDQYDYLKAHALRARAVRRFLID